MNEWTHLQELSQSSETPNKPLTALGALAAAVSAARRALFGGGSHPLVNDIMAEQFDSAGGRHGHQKGGDR
jgi:hypothetical protein